MTKKALGGFATFVPETDILDADFQQFERVAGVTFNEAQRLQLQLHIVAYEEKFAVYRAMPLRADVAKVLLVIETAAAKLGAALSSLQGASSAEQVARNILSDPPGRAGREQLATLTEHINRLGVQARQVSARMPPNIGPNGDPYRPDLIRGVHEVYRAAGGQRKVTNGRNASSGEFHGLMAAILRKLGEPVMTQGLGKAIQDALPTMEISPKKTT